MLLMVGLLAACGRPDASTSRFRHVEGGDAARGRLVMARYQCGACHVIPEVPAAAGRAGPTLAHFGSRSYIAGRLPNTPETLMRWIQDPPALMPDARMPAMGVQEADARDMAAWLLSLP